MANEKRMIYAEEAIELINGLESLPWEEETEEMVNSLTTVDAVEAELFNALKSLVNGEWVDCKLVQEALGIDFNTGFKMFDFSRTAEWNPAPLNGQKITTKFKLKNAVEVVHGQRLYNAHEVAVIIANLFGDDCACNFNSIDEWLPFKCELQDACPNPAGVACWEQYLKFRDAKMDGDEDDNDT